MASSDPTQGVGSTKSDDGFMGFWANIDPDYVLQYQEWHSCEHIPERLSVPGFVEGRRYRSVSSDPNFFMCYVTASPETLRSKAYLAALDRPTPWTQDALKHFRNPTRNIYRKIGSTGRLAGYAPYLVLQRYDDTDSSQDLFAAIASSILDARIATPVAASLYEVDRVASTIMTAERGIYSGGPGQQSRLFALGLKDRPAADAALQHLTRELSRLGASNVEGGVYWLETRLKAADVRSPAASDLETAS